MFDKAQTNRILFINACVRPGSRTLELARTVLDRLAGDVEEVDLERERIDVLDSAVLALRDACIQENDYSAPMFRFARQLKDADTLVVAAPYWDLMFPALLKVYFEAVMVNGLTFYYTPEGRPKSLCRLKRVIYVTTAGGPIGPFNFGFDYVNALARGFFHTEDVRCLAAEGLDIAGADVESILAEARRQIEAL